MAGLDSTSANTQQPIGSMGGGSMGSGNMGSGSTLAVNSTSDNTKPSNLDLTFDGDGQVITNLGGDDRIIQLLSVGNGKVLAVASKSDNTKPGNQETILVRYNSDGSLDNSFGTGGKLSTGLSYSRSSFITDDDKIIILSDNANFTSSVSRYLADGQLDTSFGMNGKYNSSDISGIFYFYSIENRKNSNNNDNETVISGRNFSATGSGAPTTKSSNISLRLDVNGQVKPFPINNNPAAAPIVIDNSVLNQIISSATVNSIDPAVQNVVNILGQVAIDRLRSQYAVASYSIYTVATKSGSDGSILIGLNGDLGTNSTQNSQRFEFLTRFNSDGIFDTNFGINGLATLPLSGVGSGSIIDKIDRLYLTQYNKNTDNISVIRIARNGTLDSTFGTNGELNLPNKIGSSGSSSDAFYTSVLIDSQDRILVGTKKYSEDFINFSRINNNGTIDTTFGINGKLKLDTNGFTSSSSTILGADDRLFLGGEVNGDLLVTKYDTGGTNDLTGGTVLPGVLAFDRSDYSINEDGTKIISITVNRTGGSDGNVSATINLTNGTAKAGEDYNSSPITVSFADKETSKTIAIPIVNDTVYEPSETVNLTLANPTNGAKLGSQTTAVLTILDDDAVPGVLSLRSAVYSFNENDTPATTVVTIDRTGGSDGEVSANLLFSDGTAIGGSDYTQTPITVTFANGETTKTVTIPIANDLLSEATETFNLALESPTGGVKIDNDKKTAVVNILDPVTIVTDDRPVIGIEIADAETAEPNNPGQFTLTRTGVTTADLTVKYSIAGTATNETDYQNLTGTATFNVGSSTATIDINPIDDNIYEGNETVILTLTDGGINYKLDTIKSAATLTITDNESIPITVEGDTPNISLLVTDADAAEELANPGQFTFKRTGATTNSLTVNYSLTGTATNESDYQKLGNTITFAAGSNTTTLNINPIDDKRYEGTETVALTLLDGGTQYKLDPSNSGTVSILENDPQTPKLSQPLPNILSIEGGSDKSTLKFTKIAQEGAGKNETFAFVVDDSQGRISGIAPGSEGYLKAALDRSKVIFSNLGNNSIDRTFDLGSQRSLTFAPGDLVELGLIANDTIDKVKLDLISGKPTSEVLFSLLSANVGNGNQAKFTTLPNDGGYEIAWSNADNKTNPVYNDLVFKVESINNFTAPIGTNLQGDSEGEVLDLRSFVGQTLKVDTVAVSDAGYNNYIGFYAVADTQGTLANGLKVTDVGYAEAAIKSAVLRSFKNETQSDLQVAGGEILAPVVIANGTFEDFLKTNPQNQANSNIHAYFNYLGANTDKVDHFRLLGDNKFGVEDIYGGGDRDYNDVVFQLNVKV
jgi:uncharacterized delta-60 repeat protein